MQHKYRHTAIAYRHQNSKHFASGRMNEHIQKGCNYSQYQHLHQGIAYKLQDGEGGKGILLPQILHYNHDNDHSPVYKRGDK